MQASFNAIKTGFKVLAPLIAGGIAGEVIMNRVPVEEYTKSVPFISDLPATIQRFVPGLVLATVTVIVFSPKDFNSASWTPAGIAAGAMVGMTVNLFAKGLERGGSA